MFKNPRFCSILSAVLLMSISQSHNITAQNVSLNNKRETAIFAGNSLWTAVNYAVQWSSPSVPVTGNTWNLGKVDQHAVFQYNHKPRLWSDVALAGTGILCGLSVIHKENQTLENAVVMLQGATLTANITHTVKLLVRRNRPYTLASGFNYSRRDDIYSFFSGHSSIAASLLTSAILLNSNATTPSVPKNLIIAGAGIGAITTAILRIKAGKHYPSDILTGLLLGTGIAWINYKIHEK